MYLITALISLAQSFSATFQPMSPEEFFSHVPIVVRAVAKKSEPKWGSDEKSSRKIYTYTEFEIIETLKGQIPSQKITVRELGGERDGVGLQVPGSAEFTPDQEFIVSLAPSAEEGVYRVFAMSQGVLSVENNAGSLTVRGLLTSQNPVSFEKTKEVIRNSTQSRRAPITKPESTTQVPKQNVEESTPVDHSTSIWILFGIIIVGAGTWMITRKK